VPWHCALHLGVLVDVLPQPTPALVVEYYNGQAVRGQYKGQGQADWPQQEAVFVG